MTSLLLSYFVHNAQNQSANISAFHDCTFTMKRRSTCDKFIALKLLEKLYNIAILFSLVYMNSNIIRVGLLTSITVFLPFFGLFYILKTASFQRFLDITGGFGHLRSFAVTLRSPMTATRKFEIVGKWRFLCYEHVTRVLIRVKGVYFACF